LKVDNYIFGKIVQTPDSVNVNAVNQQEVVIKSEQDTTGNTEMGGFGFSLERQTLISTESADTIEDVKPLPQTLRNYAPVVVEQKDTLKFDRFYFSHLNEYSNLDNRDFLDFIPAYKKIVNTNVDIDKYLSERTYSTPEIEKTEETAVAKNVTENKVEVKTEKKVEKKKVVSPKKKVEVKEVISVESKKIDAKTEINTDFKADAWVIGVILFSTFVFAFVRMFYNKKYHNIIKSGTNYQYAYKLVKEGSSSSSRVNTFLSLVFYINISMFIFLILKLLNIKVDLSDWKLYLLLILSLFIMYLGKRVANRILGYVFGNNDVVSEYLTNVWIYNIILGVFILPFIISIPFVPPEFKLPLMYIGIAIIILSLLFRILRNFRIAFKIKLSIFYLILYLCTLEILPILIIGKMISNI